MQLFATIKHLFPAADPLVDFRLQDDSDGRGPYIAAWHVDAPQPTIEELAATWESIAPVLAWDPIREQRAPLLAAADIQLNKAEDQGSTDLVAAIRTYRQALRDITKGADPDAITWPTRPW